MMPEAPPRQRSPTSVPRPVAATEDSPIPRPAAAMQTGTAHGERAAGMSAASATAMIAKPVATTRCGGQRRCRAADPADPAMTSRLNGSRVAAASIGVRCKVSCRYKVTSVITELVAAVLRKPPRDPCRSRRLPISGAGNSGAAIRRSTIGKTPARTTLATSSNPPASRPAGWVTMVVPTMKVMTAAVNTADPARLSEVAMLPSAPGGTDRAMAAARMTASGR
jgi:hypothetical protein